MFTQKFSTTSLAFFCILHHIVIPLSIYIIMNYHNNTRIHDLNCKRYTLHTTLCTVHTSLYITILLHLTIHSVHLIPHTANYTLFYRHCTLHTPQWKLHPLSCQLSTPHFTLHTAVCIEHTALSPIIGSESGMPL